MTSSVTSACSPLRDEAGQPLPLTASMASAASHKSAGGLRGGHYSTIEQRSCSANQLDVIVDILGVPSELLNQRGDYSNKRLFLLKDKKSETASSSGVVRRRPKRSTCKVLGSRPKAPVLHNGNKSKSYEEDSQDLLMEVKRRSIYAKDCRY